MVIKTAHKGNFGFVLDKFNEQLLTIDADGYIEYDDDPQYRQFGDAELANMAANSPVKAMRNAAVVEQMERILESWRHGL